MYKYTLLSLIFTVSFISCSDDGDMQPTSPLPAGDGGYNQTVKLIINSACVGCHTDPPTNNAPMALDTYDRVREAIDNRNLIGRIENGTMPPNGALTAAQIKAIKDWETNGFKQ